MKVNLTDKNASAAETAQFEPETAGREYEFVTFGLLSRRIGGDGTWYGRTNYKTEQEALDMLAKVSNQSDTFDVGGISCRFVSGRKETYEYKIVRYEQKAKVIKTAFAKI